MYKIFIEKILIYKRNAHRKNQYSILIRGEENHISNIFTFPPFVASPTDRWKIIYRIDAHVICVYVHNKNWTSILLAG